MIIRVVQLPKFRAVSFHAKNSETPENDALQMLMKWAIPKGIYNNDPSNFQIYGRNYPSPKPNDKLRGYELLLTIPDDYELEIGVSEICFPGGLFAVISSKGIMSLQHNYLKLADWIKSNEEYILDYPQEYDYDTLPSLELENHINPDITDIDSILIDAYVPIRKR